MLHELKKELGQTKPMRKQTRQVGWTNEIINTIIISIVIFRWLNNYDYQRVNKVYRCIGA